MPFPLGEYMAVCVYVCDSVTDRQTDRHIHTYTHTHTKESKRQRERNLHQRSTKQYFVLNPKRLHMRIVVHDENSVQGIRIFWIKDD
jgi:hypothetical protein